MNVQDLFLFMSGYFFQPCVPFCRLHHLVTSRQQDKQNLSILERKLQDERKSRTAIEVQLSTERKAKKMEEAATARAVAMAAAAR